MHGKYRGNPLQIAAGAIGRQTCEAGLRIFKPKQRAAADQPGQDWPVQPGQLLDRLLSHRFALAGLLVLITLFILASHQILPVIDRDEARFAQASRQMAETGDLVIIRFQDEWRAKKPAGIYWLQAASAKIFSIDAIASYRLPSLLGLLASLFLVWHFVSSLWPDAPRRQQMTAMLGLASGLLVLAEAHLAKTDMVLAAICLSSNSCSGASGGIGRSRTGARTGSAFGQRWRPLS